MSILSNTTPDFILESVRSMPPLPASVQRLLQLVHGDVEPDFKDISAVIEQDQTLTARILRAANSSFYGTSRQIATVRQATILLGTEAVVNMALSISVMNLQDSMACDWPLDPDAYWQHNMAVALAARELARYVEGPDGDLAFVAGLLHDVGKLLMMRHFGVSYGQVVMAAQDGTEPLHILEREIFEFDHATVGKALCDHWNIPTLIARAVAEHHAPHMASPGTEGDLVRDANELVKMLRLGDSGNPFAELRRAPNFSDERVVPEPIEQLIEQLPAEVARAGAAFGRYDEGAGHPPLEERPVVLLDMSTAGERRMLGVALFACGCRPVHADLFDHQAGEAPAGLITDLPLDAEHALRCSAAGIPILEFAAWQAEHLQPRGAHFNTKRLHEWLEGLASLAPSGQ